MAAVVLVVAQWLSGPVKCSKKPSEVVATSGFKTIMQSGTVFSCLMDEAYERKQCSTVGLSGRSARQRNDCVCLKNDAWKRVCNSQSSYWPIWSATKGTLPQLNLIGAATSLLGAKSSCRFQRQLHGLTVPALALLIARNMYKKSAASDCCKCIQAPMDVPNAVLSNLAAFRTALTVSALALLIARSMYKKSVASDCCKGIKAPMNGPNAVLSSLATSHTALAVSALAWLIARNMYEKSVASDCCKCIKAPMNGPNAVLSSLAASHTALTVSALVLLIATNPYEKSVASDCCKCIKAQRNGPNAMLSSLARSHMTLIVSALAWLNARSMYEQLLTQCPGHTSRGHLLEASQEIVLNTVPRPHQPGASVRGFEHIIMDITMEIKGVGENGGEVYCLTRSSTMQGSKPVRPFGVEVAPPERGGLCFSTK